MLAKGPQAAAAHLLLLFIIKMRAMSIVDRLPHIYWLSGGWLSLFWPPPPPPPLPQPPTTITTNATKASNRNILFAITSISPIESISAQTRMDTHSRRMGTNRRIRPLAGTLYT